MAKSQRFLSVGLLTVLLVTGCGEKYHPVSGTVTIDGRPFANGSITLVPVDGGPPSFGGTDEQGRFTLETTNRAGTRPGTYRVVLNKFNSPKVDPKDEEGRFASQNEMPVAAVPAKLSNAETTDLVLTVPSADGKYEIAAKSK